MATSCPHPEAELLDERGSPDFRSLFGDLISRSTRLDTAILRIRLSAVDLSAGELGRVARLRVLVAEVNTQTVEGEAYAMAMDPGKEANLARLLAMLGTGTMEIRSAPLGGWSPDFTVFSDEGGPHSLLLGDHWFRRPFPHRGPAWAARFGSAQASRAKARLEEIWRNAHDISPAVKRLMERTPFRPRPCPVDTPNGPR